MTRIAVCALLSLALGCQSSSLACPSGTQAESVTVGRRSVRQCVRADGVPHGPVVEQWADASEHLCGVLEDGVKQGRWRHWYDNGQLMSDADYRAGHLVALTTWAPDGDLMQTARFEDDLSDGTTVVSMPGRHEQHFDAGERVGMWTIEYSDGRLDVRVYGQHSILLAANGRPLPPPKAKLVLSDGSVLRHAACERARVDNGGTSPCLDLFERVQRCALTADPRRCEDGAVAQFGTSGFTAIE